MERQTFLQKDHKTKINGKARHPCCCKSQKLFNKLFHNFTILPQDDGRLQQQWL